MVKKRNKKETVYNKNKNKNNIHIYIDNSKKTKRASSGYSRGPSSGSSTIIHTNSAPQPYPVLMFGENKAPAIANVTVPAPVATEGAQRLGATPKQIDTRLPTILEETSTVPNIATIASRRGRFGSEPGLTSSEKRLAKMFDDASDEIDDVIYTPQRVPEAAHKEKESRTEEKRERKQRHTERNEAEKDSLRNEIRDLGGNANWERSNNVKDLRRERNRLKNLNKRGH